MLSDRIKPAWRQTTAVFIRVIPMLCSILLVVSLCHQLFRDNYERWFSGNYLLDPLVGALAGSISFGIPVTSYIAGGELLAAGVSLLAVTAFIMTWTTVGLVMIPLEAGSLGVRFAVVRNVLNFFFALLVAMATVFTLGLWP
ncbi:MAG: permease [Desulfobulbaceae bacterium]|nr:MAG: permease [Desulfobulbaceae bacterium]